MCARSSRLCGPWWGSSLHEFLRAGFILKYSCTFHKHRRNCSSDSMQTLVSYSWRAFSHIVSRQYHLKLDGCAEGFFVSCIFASFGCQTVPCGVFLRCVPQRVPYLAGLEHCFSATPFFTQTNASQRSLSYKSPVCCADEVCKSAGTKVLLGADSHAGGNNGN